MKKLDLKVNEKLEVLKDNLRYKCIIQELEPEYMSITIPGYEGRYLLCDKEEELTLSYLEAKEVYTFKAKVIGKKIERIAMIILTKPYDIRHLQRRNYVRVEIIEEVLFSVLPKRENNKSIEENLKASIEWIRGSALDLSGGGIRLQSRQDMNQGDYMLLNIPFVRNGIMLKGKIVRKEKKDDKTYVYGVGFQGLRDKETDKIVRFVFELMRQHRNKGLKGE